jgi:hypothetical protein
MFDNIVNAPKQGSPSVLYHYTSWDAAKAILASREFWATSHDCTNDRAELVSADEVILEVAKELLNQTMGLAAEVLKSFIGSYSELHVTRVISICLACFSESRDDASQWKNYGDGGHGLCLGIKVVNELPPRDPPSALIRVDYSEESWRAELKQSFGDMCTVLSRAQPNQRNLELGLNAFLRKAAFMSISAKQAQWAAEREVRRVTIVTRRSGISLEERVAPDGVKRYLPVSVRTEGKLIALAEIIVGSNRDFEESRQELEKYLAEIGYKRDEMEYPQITVSVVPSQTSATVC